MTHPMRSWKSVWFQALTLEVHCFSKQWGFGGAAISGPIKWSKYATLNTNEITLSLKWEAWPNLPWTFCVSCHWKTWQCKGFWKRVNNVIEGKAVAGLWNVQLLIVRWSQSMNTKSLLSKWAESQNHFLLEGLFPHPLRFFFPPI